MDNHGDPELPSRCKKFAICTSKISIDSFAALGWAGIWDMCLTKERLDVDSEGLQVDRGVHL